MNREHEFPRPGNFPYKEVFYSDGVIAMMLGTYKESPDKSLGLRWMEAESELGYPNIFGMSMWMVVPDKLALYILKGINGNLGKEGDFICNRLDGT